MKYCTLHLVVTSIQNKTHQQNHSCFVVLAWERKKHGHVHMIWPRPHSAASELEINGACSEFHTHTGGNENQKYYFAYNGPHVHLNGFRFTVFETILTVQYTIITIASYIIYQFTWYTSIYYWMWETIMCTFVDWSFALLELQDCLPLASVIGVVGRI